MIGAVLLWLCSSLHPGENEILLIHTIQQYRLKKDEVYRTSPASPVPETLRPHFTGLKYFPIDLDYRFELRLRRFRKPDTTRIMTTVGSTRRALRHGYFRFMIADKPCTLYVYKFIEKNGGLQPHLFIPFKDATCGQETYAGGRYLDLQENGTGLYVLDFNLAYNPSCAYGKPGYVCPIPPGDNELEVPIRAGEKAFSRKPH